MSWAMSVKLVASPANSSDITVVLQVARFKSLSRLLYRSGDVATSGYDGLRPSFRGSCGAIDTSHSHHRNDAQRAHRYPLYDGRFQHLVRPLPAPYQWIEQLRLVTVGIRREGEAENAETLVAAQNFWFGASREYIEWIRRGGERGE